MKDSFKLTLCQQGCCPIVEINTDTNQVIITDDLGGKVSLTTDQFKILLERCANVNGE
ncbi:hypothetical protein [Desulfosporosinus sp.]|uniref:hypothetical protein n=1 Tax=Desulfosporosinus sp. TaxID=157907 RepID=UPI0025B940F6|nr:hypothetical protein [Desulfosporosinus sp.]MBC2725082.1 hypothetical protein [Desulfosporosinus sp.]